MNLPTRNEVHTMVDFLVEKGLGDILHGWKQNYDRIDLNNFFYELGDYDVYGSAGFSKVCVPLNDDWVLKFPLNVYDNLNWCGIEAENYALAKKLGLARFFAPCFYWGKIDGLLVYIQRRVEKDTDRVEESIFNYCSAAVPRQENESDEIYSERVQSFVDSEATDEDNVFANFTFKNEIERGKFFNFIEEQTINDLHCGNFGYYNGHCIIFDYSGY